MSYGHKCLLLFILFVVLFTILERFFYWYSFRKDYDHAKKRPFSHPERYDLLDTNRRSEPKIHEDWECCRTGEKKDFGRRRISRPRIVNIEKNTNWHEMRL